ncbi:MAG: ribosome biogenesis GTPase Der [Terrimicrobiaceae bacterium]|nr:ribosome biogenesis GTPase Der [Terrimicrobiaceae bacterium]
MRNVAIVGRPNVGKSALFNRLAGSRISIVHDQPGVTRDRIVAVCKLGRFPFEIVDTGGIGAEPDPDFAEDTREAAFIAMESADLILFVVDAFDGVTPLDADLASLIRSSGRPVVLVVNKVDTEGHEMRALEFERLGFEFSSRVSAAHGRGIDVLVALIERTLPPGSDGEPVPSGEAPKLALVGRPNVGKSSLVNAILEDKRTIVSDIPGTTRDAVDIATERDGRPYVLCDTAGIRHRSKHNTSVEVFSVMRSEKTIGRADLNILVIDATSGVTSQDKKIAGLIQKAKKPAVIALNKWDLIVGAGGHDRELLREHTERIRSELFFLDYAPVVILSAKTGDNVRRLFTTVEKVRQHATRRAGTGELNRLLRAAMERQPPPTRANRRFKLLYATQTNQPGTIPAPHFVLFVNDPRLIPDSYVNYLCARIRDEWEYPGLPILIRLRGRQGRDSQVSET